MDRPHERGWGEREERRRVRENGVRPHVDLNPGGGGEGGVHFRTKLTRTSALSSRATAAAAAVAFDDEDAAIATAAIILLIASFDDVDDFVRRVALLPSLDYFYLFGCRL